MLLGLLAHAGSLGGAYQFDDHNVIVLDPRVHSLGAWAGDLSRGIRPLLKLTYTLNWISGAGLAGFHLANLGLHLGNALLVRALAGVLAPDRRRLAFLAGALFAVHPLLTEGTTYVCGRSASLCAAFQMAGLLAYVRARRRGLDRRARLQALGAFIAALLVKETALVLPLVLLLWEAARDTPHRDLKRALRVQAPLWIPLLAAPLLLLHPRYGTLLACSAATRSAWANLLAQVDAVWYLAQRAVLPMGLDLDPDLPVRAAVDGLWVLRLLCLLLPVAWALWRLRRHPAPAFGILWAALALLPTNSILARLDLVNERQAYLPMAGLCLAAAWGGDRLMVRLGPRAGWAAASLVLLVLGAGTFARNRVYATEVSLWEDTARKSPGKPRAWNNLGYAYALEGRRAEAIAAYHRALALDPGYDLARANLARAGLLPDPSPGTGSGTASAPGTPEARP